MNQCNFCGSPVKATDKFCKGCGAPVAPTEKQMEQASNNQTTPGAARYSTPMNNGQGSAQGKTPGIAIGALVCGVIGFIICGIPLGLVSISLGATALNHFKNFPKDSGKGLAIAGIVLGIVDIIAAIIAIVLQNAK